MKLNLKLNEKESSLNLGMKEIQKASGGSGDGDMRKAVYDTNNNGIVDNAETVNGYTVEIDVPSNAVFTDTVYDDTNLRNKVDSIHEPTKVSDLENDSGFVTSDVNNLSNYFNKDQENAKLNEKANCDDVPTKTSELTNDSGFITDTDLSPYALKTDVFSGNYNDLTNKPNIPTKTSDLNNDSGFIDSSGLSAYALKTQIPTKTSELTNDSGFITIGVLSPYALKSELFSGDYNDLTNKPTIPTVPTTISAFTNDSGYITNSVGNLTNYYDKEYIDNKLGDIETILGDL